MSSSVEYLTYLKAVSASESGNQTPDNQVPKGSPVKNSTKLVGCIFGSDMYSSDNRESLQKQKLGVNIKE